ncbi:MAG: hypothetical protein A2521_01810 [Deltaproteobacteria bacterium RIFOXYD12_FULL_57_12]|nr:MAG: hypothetical protein A2521_01810 [Deltaproteobacteria bacterium RIFOXYD12_FULL_57_12]
MAMSFRTARNLGLIFLLIIIFVQNLFSYSIMARNSAGLSEIIARDEVKLRSWYDVAEIIAEAKDQLYDYRLGKTDLIAPADLLINKALKEIEAISRLATETDEKATIDEIIRMAKRLKQAMYAYEIEVREGYRGDSAAKEMETIVVSTADRIVGLGRSAAAYVSKKIEEKNQELLQTSSFSRKILATVFMFAIAATIAVALFMAHALARPVRELVDGTLRLAEGDLAFRVQVGTKDEIGQLANSFNAMAEALRKSQHELLEAKIYTDNIISSMTNSLVVVNQDGSIRKVNRATCDLLSYSEAELIGQPVSIFLTEDFSSETGLNRLINRGLARNIETTYLAKNGRKIPVLFATSVMHHENGKFEAVCVAQDITIQAEALRASHLASLGELAAGVAHEINNPINGIINFAQILADDIEQGEKPTNEIPLRIIREGDRIATIVRSLLFFARETEKEKKLVHITEIMDEVLALTEAQIHKDGIHLEIDFPEDMPIIMANFQQIQQVFLNIINNARYALNKKYPDPHPDKYLLIRGTEEKENDRSVARIQFLDHGTGIPAGIQDKVLNPFFTTKPAGRGTGLGLAISHGIIVDHNGTLQLESREGEFTSIVVSLPASIESSVV